MRSLSRRSFLATSLASAASVALGACAPDGPSTVSRTLFVFDTVVRLRAACPESLMDLLVGRCAWFDDKLSRTRQGSDVWNVNHAGGAPVEVAEETARVIEASLACSQASGGLFDVTIGAVSSLWDFDAGVRPSDDAVAAALAHVGYEGLHVHGRTVTLDDSEAMIDLGGIAKGYIADDLARTLRAGGCESASISLGGNVYVLGESFDGDAWNVGIQDPNDAAGEVVAAIEARDESVVTSGLYERSFERGGVLYHHILDPRTGFPADTDLLSSSVAASRSTEADAWSTILFLMGCERSLELLERSTALDGLLVDDAGEVLVPSGSRFEVS